MSVQPIIINGSWRASTGTKTFQATNPTTGETLENEFPVSPWDEIEECLQAAQEAFVAMSALTGEQIAGFLDSYANQIEARSSELVAAAHAETGLPVSPRLQDVELPRTTNQLRQAAEAARTGSWTLPTIDTQTGIRSMLGPIGPVAVFGPNNFPFAFNGIAGGDFAAAIAAGNPVIAKGHPCHPTTTKIFGEAALAAVEETGMPAATVQLIYRTSHEDGAKLASHRLLGAIGYTGARNAGLALKQAADNAGTPIYLELSSINPIFVLPNVLAERGDELADEFSGSCLMGTGQFCTNPGMVVLPAGDAAEKFVVAVTERFSSAAPGVLLSPGVQSSLNEGVNTLQAAGAELLCGGAAVEEAGVKYQNTLLRVSGEQFLKAPEKLQTEAFGNESLLVVADDVAQMAAIADKLEGNLTGCVYSDAAGKDDDSYQRVATVLRRRVGRLLNDKMPTGVAVSAAMNHGGPYPATGHPGFTAVGIPASLRRFGMLHCYDNVRAHRLPPTLQDKNSNQQTWRLIDGQWSQADVPV